MSTIHSNIPQPELMANMLSIVPVSYRDHFNSLMTQLPFEGVNLFINLFTDIFNYLPTTLPEGLTTLASRNSVLPSYILTMVEQFIHTLNTAHCYLLTIINFNLPSQNISNLCTYILDDLHLNLYTNMDNTRTQLAPLLSVLQPLPLEHTSSELDTMLIALVENLITNLSLLDLTIYEELVSQPDVPFGDPYWDLVDFFNWFDIHTCIERLQNLSDDNLDAEDYDMDNLSITYVHQAITDAETDDRCTVCLEDIKDGDNARRLRCLHAFHVNCINRWLEENDTCPMCRTHINATHEIESTLDGA